MVTNNFNWGSNDWVLLDAVTVTNHLVPNAPVVPPIPTPIKKVKLRSVQELIEEEKAYIAKRRTARDPYSDPDVFI